MKHRILKLLALLLTFGLIAAACGGDSDDGGESGASTTTEGGGTESTSPPTTETVVESTTTSEGEVIEYGGVVTLGLEAEATGLRPWEDSCSPPCYNMFIAFFDKLFEINSDFQPSPWLATGATPNEDFTQWVVTLREGVKFHNGVDFNAQTVADMFTIQQAGAASAGAIAASGLAGVEATGDYEVTYTLNSPNSAFLAFLTRAPLGMVFEPAAAAADPDGFADAPVGTGPFVIASRDVDNETVGVRNADYWLSDDDGNQLPYLDEMRFRPIPDEGTRLSSILSGTINAMQTLRQGTIRDARDAADGLTLYEFQGNNTGGGMFNTLVPPYDDTRVRVGLTMMNNQDAVIDALGGTGISLPATQWFSPDSPWYSQAAADAWIQFDPAGGAALLQEYIDDPARSDGLAPGSNLVVELSCPPDPTLIAAMQVIEQVWSASGLVDVTLTQFDQATHINNALGRENGFVGIHQAHCWRWSSDDDPSLPLNSEFAAPTPEIAAAASEALGATVPFSPTAFSNYWDPEMFGWLVAAIQTDDFETRKGLYEQVMIRLAEQAPVWYSGHTATLIATTDDMVGLNGWTTPDGQLGAGFPGGEGRWHRVRFVG
ncbi:MAG: ABC transporter substrate-binding protein [Acidimicrobiales bacterium]